jgi:hypothetical protein
MKTTSWILLCGGLVTLAVLPGACGSTGGATTTRGVGGASSASAGTGGTAVALVADCHAPTASPSQGACYTPPAMIQPPACPHAMPDAGPPDGGDAGTDGGDAGTGGAGTGGAGSGGAGTGGGTTDGGTDGGHDGGAVDAGHDSGVKDAGPNCAPLMPNPNACGTCLVSTCCEELEACNAIPGCIACVTDPDVDPGSCTTAAIQSALATLTTCANGCCSHCFAPPGAPCNPVTNAGCDVDGGEACDLYATGFACYPPPNDQGLCSPCTASGPNCGGGLHCLADNGGDESFCARYCCDDGDCSETGKCDTTALGAGAPAGVGLCVPK